MQRPEAAGVLQRMADLVRGDGDGRQRAAVEVVGREAHDFRGGVVVIAAVRDLRGDVAQAERIEQLARGLAARARVAVRGLPVAAHDGLHPQPGQHGEHQQHQRENHERHRGAASGSSTTTLRKVPSSGT